MSYVNPTRLQSLAMPSAFWQSTRFRLRVGGIRACQWAWPILPKCCGVVHEAQSVGARIGSTATAFVLSNGHGSMLLYAVLHLTGYELLSIDDPGFRRGKSITPGHPERGLTPGVETTTGPLGQGLANAVGMALVERLLAAQFNEPEFDIVDHYTYAFSATVV